MAKGTAIVRIVNGSVKIELHGDHSGTTIDLGDFPSIEFRDSSGLDAGDFREDPEGCTRWSTTRMLADGSYLFEID